MKQKHVIDNVIIMLVLGLLIFHTFTFFQNIYNYYTTVAVFAIVVVLAVLRNGGSVKIDTSNPLLLLCVMVFVLGVVGTLFKEMTLVYMVGAYLPYVIWPILYLITEPKLTQKGKKKPSYWCLRCP